MRITPNQLRTLIKEVIDENADEREEYYRQARAGGNPLAGAIDRSLEGGGGPNYTGGMIRRICPQNMKLEERMQVFGSMIRLFVSAKGDVERAIRNSDELYEKGNLVSKALAAGVGPGGGFLIPEEFSSDLIELLRPMSVVRSLGARQFPMPSGTLTLPKLASGAAAGYIGENSNIGTSEQTFGQVTLTQKKLAVLTPISNDLLRFTAGSSADINASAVVQEDILAAMAQREDAAFIRDDGTAQTPKGLRFLVPAANVTAANSTVNLANVTSDMASLILLLRNANVRFIRPGWIMAPAAELYLKTVRDGNGNFAFRDEMNGGIFWGWPYRVTTQIPQNLGGGSDESEVYLADFADILIGDATEINIDVSDTAAYHDGSNVVASFSLDQTVIRCIAQHDIGTRHEESIAVLNQVTWTPA